VISVVNGFSMRGPFSEAAVSYDAAAVLAAEVGRRMAERLDYVKIAPHCMADIGCATGDGIRELSRRYPKSLPLAIDFARPMLQQVQARSSFMQRLRNIAPRLLNADVEALPLKSGSLGLAWSNLMLQWLDDPLPAFREMQRSLEVGGLLTFAMLGPDTLKEIRAACIAGGVEVPLRRFHDMHDIGDMLVAAGFADPVMDMEMITFTYRSPRGLLRDQRHLGVRDALFGELGWRDWRRVFATWQAQHQSAALPATFEIVYGHAWKPEQREISDGRAIINFVKK
jgi:malonyl-CoA O-methyltransferase